MADEIEKPDILSAFGVTNNSLPVDTTADMLPTQPGNSSGADILSAFGVDSTTVPSETVSAFPTTQDKGNQAGADILSAFGVSGTPVDQDETVNEVVSTIDTATTEPEQQRRLTVGTEQEFYERIDALEYEYGDGFYQIPEDWGLDSSIGVQFEADLRAALANEIERTTSESGVQNLEYAGLLEEQGVDTTVQVPIRDPEEIQRNLEAKADEVQALLDDPNESRSGITRELLDRGMSLQDIIATVTVLEIAPVSGTFLGVQDIPIMYEEASQQYQEGDYKGAAITAGLMGVETIASIFGTVVGAKGVLDIARTSSRAAARSRAGLRQAVRNNAAIAEQATADAAQEAAERAASVASRNPDVSDQLILAFEARTGKRISTVNEEGRLVIDPERAREAGQETLEEVSGSALELTIGPETITQPILQPEKFNAIVAIASDYQQRYPDAFSGDRTIIDSLFDLTVNRELIGGQELLDDLNKYGLSFEDYVLTVVGSGSEAGRILNKLSQISRARPAGVAAADEANSATRNAHWFQRGIMRFENVRRGGLVSQIATAARNVTSATIRLPLESLGNVMDTAIYRATNEGAVAGIMEMFNTQNWRDSFSQIALIYSRPDVARAYTNFLLQRPELANQFNRMFNNINEIQELTGRGSGSVFDKIMSPLEDAVDFLNIPNRWQEHLMRRGVFFGELQRLTRNEYGIDLIDTLQDGKLADLLNDASSVRPEGARSFNVLIDDAVTRSLDVTYAKMPDVPMFRSFSQFIVRNGLTVAIPFPRFMFNSMELLAQYGAGASIPLTRKVTSMITGGRIGAGALTAKDRQRITRNLLGLVAIGAAYQYRTSEDAPADYKQMNTSEGVVMDTSPQFPMRQFLYIGEATRRLEDGTFTDWFNVREFSETFSGSNLRAGTGNVIIEEIAALADGTDLTTRENIGRVTGELLGQYLSTWAVPFAQLIEAQRAVGERGLEYRDVREDPILDAWTTFFNELERPMAQRGVSITAEEEAALPLRQYVFSENRRRVNQMSRVLLGLSQSSAGSEYGEYFINKGFNEYDLSSTSEVPTVQRWENEQIREVLPIIAEAAQRRERTLRAEYEGMSDSYKDSFTEEQHVNNNVIPLINGLVSDLRTNIREMDVGAENQYTSSVVAYRRLPPDIRRLSSNYFVERFDREPNPTDTRDLQSLVMIGRALRETYR